ncbi:MAG: radical SAM protein [Lentisphaeria bacterium]|nr:radical SAM protein [Lentisphaeria bacterium]
MKKSRFITGLQKVFFYIRMSLVCAWRYRSVGVLLKASKFTSIFFKHKLVKLPSGEYKLDFYMPRYPSAAFFTAMEDKVLRHPPRPVSVVLSISKACAYKCPHCYQRKDSSEELPLPLLLENVRKMRDFGIVAWAVEGGEPLLRFERLEAVLKEIKGLEVWVNSTGYSATPEKIHRLAELQVTGIMSSIHSVNPEEHDVFTGMPGSWQRALNFLKECRLAGMLVGFNTVLSDEQIVAGGIDEIMALAKEHECDYIQLIHPKACGAWMGKEFDSKLSQEAIRIATEAQLRYNSSKEKHSPVLTAQVFEESPGMLGCCCGGIDRFYVGAAGDVQPCEFVNLSFGNLKEVSFETAYQRMRQCFAVPCEEWTCCTHAREIAKCSGEQLPLPWNVTEKLTKNWKPGTPTKVYDSIGIYK